MKVMLRVVVCLAFVTFCSGQLLTYGARVAQEYADGRKIAVATALAITLGHKDDIIWRQQIGTPYSTQYAIMKSEFGSFSTGTQFVNTTRWGAYNFEAFMINTLVLAVDDSWYVLKSGILDPLDFAIGRLVQDVNKDNKDFVCWANNKAAALAIYNNAVAAINNDLITIKAKLKAQLVPIVANLTTEYNAEKIKIIALCGSNVTCINDYIQNNDNRLTLSLNNYYTAAKVVITNATTSVYAIVNTAINTASMALYGIVFTIDSCQITT